MEKISPQTLARTAILVLTLINQVLTMLGINPLPFAKDGLYALVTAAATVAATFWAWWKNNSFTQEALYADKLLREMKEGE